MVISSSTCSFRGIESVSFGRREARRKRKTRMWKKEKEERNRRDTDSVSNLLRSSDVPRVFRPKIAIFPQSQVCSSITQQAKRIINLFYWSIISVQRYRADEFNRKATNYCIRFGRSLLSAISLPAQVTINRYLFFFFFLLSPVRHVRRIFTLTD